MIPSCDHTGVPGFVGFIAYYTDARTHLSLGKDSPQSRPVSPPVGRVIAIPHVGGRHHRYLRRAA